MFTRRSLALLALGLLSTAVAAAPSLAQHGDHMGGGGDDHQQGQHEGMGEHMGDMHSDEMMEQMSTMMDHMSEMVGDMHEYHEQLGSMEHMAGADGNHHDAAMHAMAQGMEEMLPYMDGMVKHMRSFMEEPHDGHMGEAMEALVKHMDTMLQAGRDVMATIHGMSGDQSGRPSEAGHSTHNH